MNGDGNLHALAQHESSVEEQEKQYERFVDEVLEDMQKEYDDIIFRYKQIADSYYIDTSFEEFASENM